MVSHPRKCGGTNQRSSLTDRKEGWLSRRCGQSPHRWLPSSVSGTHHSYIRVGANDNIESRANGTCSMGRVASARSGSSRRSHSVTICEDLRIDHTTVKGCFAEILPGRSLADMRTGTACMSSPSVPGSAPVLHNAMKKCQPARTRGSSVPTTRRKASHNISDMCGVVGNGDMGLSFGGGVMPPSFQAGTWRTSGNKQVGEVVRGICCTTGNRKRRPNKDDHMNTAVVALFVWCGASELGGLGLILFMKKFSKICEIYGRELPPKCIVMDAVSSMKASCMIQPSADKTHEDDFCLTLSDFSTLLMNEMRVFASVKVQGKPTASTNPPTLCIVLAAMVPKTLARICGAEAVDYLRSPLTIAHAVKRLEPQSGDEAGLASDAVCDCTSMEVVTSTQQQMRCEKDVGYFPCGVVSPSATSMEFSCSSFSDSSFGTEGTVAGGSYMAPNRLQSGMICKVPPAPRYMMPKLLDEISTSIIARAKARKLMDRLRNNAIPINRQVCFARIFYSQRARSGASSVIGDYCALTESSDSDSEALVQNVPDPLQGKLHPTNILKWPLYDEYFRGYPRRRRKREPTKKSLEGDVEAQFSCLKVCENPRISHPCSVATANSLTLEAPESMLSSSLNASTSGSSKPSEKSLNPQMAPMTAHQRRMSILLKRCSSREGLSTAEFSAARFGMYGTATIRPVSASTGSTARDVDDKTTRGKGRTWNR